MFSSAIHRLNERRDATGDAGADAGFTLIELMVVLLILAILLAIAIPTFLGVTKSANDRSVQSNLNTALTNAKSLYESQGQSYLNANITGFNSASFVSSLNSAEPALTFTAGASASLDYISTQVSTPDGNGIVMAAYSKSSNNCWLVYDNPTSPTVATTNTPWINSTFTGGQGTVASPTISVTPTTATSVAVPTTTGTQYAEIKGGTVTSSTVQGDCVASQPIIPVGATYQWSTTAFPAL
jgi:type IV pilus assembly protein PilA